MLVHKRLLLLIAALVTLLGLAEPSRSAMIRNDAKDYGYVQYWNVCPSGTPPIEGTISGKGINGKQPFSSLPPGSLLPYSAALPGGLALEVHSEKQVLPPLTLNIGKMRFFTVIFRLNEAGKVVTEVREDTYAYNASDPGAITVYNFTTEGEITCGRSGAAPVILGPYGTSTTYEGMSGATGTVAATLTTPRSKRPRNAEIPLSFDQTKRWAIIFVNDTRGRIVPLVSPLGYEPERFTEYVFVPDDPTSTPSPTQ